MAGIFLRQGDSFVALREEPYEAEAILQELIAEHPHVLSGDDFEHGDLLLVWREAGVRDQEGGGSRWALDHLYLDGDGVPTLVEVKRSIDTRARREVVAQMLDYAANAAVSWSGGRLRTLVEEHARRRGATGAEVLREAFDVADADEYWSAVEANLAAERLRLIFVSDEIGPELRRIIEFMNGQMTATTVLGIEVKQYIDETGRQMTIVPRLVGQTQNARDAKRRPRSPRTSWDLDSVLARLADRDGREAAVARQLVDRLSGRGDLRMWFGTGLSDSSVIFGLSGHGTGLLAIYTSGTIELRTGYLSQLPPFDSPDVLSELVDRLDAIPGVAFPPDRASRPNSPIVGLATDGSLDRFARGLEWALDEIASSAVLVD